MNTLLRRSLPKLVFGLLLASGLATGAVAASAQPAEAGVVVSIGFGGGGYGYAPAPAYHWYRWHDGYGWHRRWVPFGWAPPVAFYPHPFYPVPVVYGRPYPRPYYYGAPPRYYAVAHDRWSRNYYGSPHYAHYAHYDGWHGGGHYAFHR